MPLNGTEAAACCQTSLIAGRLARSVERTPSESTRAARVVLRNARLRQPKLALVQQLIFEGE